MNRHTRFTSVGTVSWNATGTYGSTITNAIANMLQSNGWSVGNGDVYHSIVGISSLAISISMDLECGRDTSTVGAALAANVMATGYFDNIANFTIQDDDGCDSQPYTGNVVGLSQELHNLFNSNPHSQTPQQQQQQQPQHQSTQQAGCPANYNNVGGWCFPVLGGVPIPDTISEHGMSDIGLDPNGFSSKINDFAKGLGLSVSALAMLGLLAFAVLKGRD